MDCLAGRFRMLVVDLYRSGRSSSWTDNRPLTLADEVALLEPGLGGRWLMRSGDRLLARWGRSAQGGAGPSGVARFVDRLRARALLTDGVGGAIAWPL